MNRRKHTPLFEADTKNQHSPMENTVLAILPLPDFALRIKTESIDTFLPIPAIEY